MANLVCSTADGISRCLKKSTNLFVIVQLGPNPDGFVMLLLPFELLEVIQIIDCIRHVRTTWRVYDIATYTEDIREQTALATHFLQTRWAQISMPVA
jgi:hypothetical protein